MRYWLKATALAVILVGMASLQARERVNVDFEHNGKEQTASMYAYDASTYATAYQTFVGSSDLKDAYAVALAAVKQRPKDVSWRYKLYQVARWSGHDDMAMDQLLFLIDKTDQLQYINLGIQMAEQLGDPEILRDLLRLKAKQVSLSDKERVKLARSHEEMGDPEQAISYLKSQWHKKKKVVYLQKMADIYARMGALKLEIKVLKLLSQYDVASIDTVVREARAYFAQNNLKQAFAVLQAAKLTAPKNNKAYWELYADTAWHLQKTDDSLYAYKLLAKNKQLDDLGMRRYIMLTGKTDAYKALQLCVKGWQEFKRPVYLMWFVQYSFKLENWNKFDRIYQRFGKAAKLIMANLPAYKTAKIQTLLAQKNYAAAQKAYLAAIKQDPKDNAMKLAYLWFLIDRQLKPELRQRLVQWQSLKYNSDDFSLAFAVGYRLLGYNHLAIMLLHQGLPKHMADVVYLTNYLDQVMEMRNADGEATDYERALRGYIWALIQQQSKHSKFWKDKTFAVNYAKVARILAPGQPTLNIMNYLSQFPQDETARDTILAWALANRYYAAASQLYNQSRLARQKTAPWIRLTLALHDFNKDEMHTLLSKHLAQLPVRDRVVAAHRNGEETQAEQLAYRALEEYPSNQKTYELFRQTMLPRSDYFDFSPEHVTTQLLMWQNYQTHGRYFVTPTIALMPYFDIRDQHGRNPVFITNVPNTDTEAGLAVHKILPRGYLDGSLGMRDAMKTFATSDWRWLYELTDKWTMIWNAGIHEPAEESDYMTAGAMQNRLGVQFIDRVTVRDEVSFELTQHYFYGQDEEAVSNGQVYRAAYTRRMWLRYPDYFVRVYGSVNEFHNKPDVTGTLDSLVPPGQQAAASGQLLLPSSFTQYGVALGVGERYREEYTHEWKPFAIASLFRNNNSAKLGTIFDGGIAGTVFGRDHLALFASHTAGVEGNANTRFVVGAAYRIYF